MISLILPSRNEGSDLAATIESGLHAGADEVIVIDDASIDGSAVGTGCRTIHFQQPMGPNVCRNVGAAAADGSVLVFADAHVRFECDLKILALEALERQAILFPICRVMEGAHIGYGGHWVNGPQGPIIQWNPKVPTEPFTELTGLMGSVYVMPKTIFSHLGGFVQTPCWGYDEEGLSMKALACGVKMFLVREAVIFHRFRAVRHYPAEIYPVRNMILTLRILLEPASWEAMRSRFMAEVPTDYAAIKPTLDLPETQYQHELHQKRRTVSDEEIQQALGLSGL
jgi:glycosyltransferase involved in cell wall biosynthesis